MGLLSRITGAITGGVRADLGATASEGMTLEEAMRHTLEGVIKTASGVSVTPDNSMRVASVYACVRLITGSVANMPLPVMRQEEDRKAVKAKEHPLWKVLTKRPNDWMTPQDFRRMLTAHCLLRGNGYALIVRSRGRIIELLPMMADRVEVKQLADMKLEYTYTRLNGVKVKIPPKDILHIRGMTLDGVTGLSPLTYAREAVGSSIQAERASGRLFQHGTIIGGALEHPQKLSKEAHDRIKASIEDKYAGAENAFRTMILEEGLKFTVPQLSAADAQFIEQRKFSRSDIAMFFGVPPHMIGDVEKSTSWGSGIEQQNIGFLQFTAEDWLIAWEQAIARDLIAEEEDDKIYAKFNRNALLRGDVKTRIAMYNAGRASGFLCNNDIREFEDMNAIEGGDDYSAPLNSAHSGLEPKGDENEPENKPARN